MSAIESEPTAASDAGPPPSLYDLDALLALDLPKRRALLGPVLAEGGATLLRGAGGVGKSWLGLAIAHAVAAGGAVLAWQAPRPRRVVVVDGASPLDLLQERIRLVAAGAADPKPASDRLRVLAAAAERAPVDLSSAAGRAAVERALQPGADLLVLDSLESLLPVRPRPAAWAELALWLRELRRRGIAVLILAGGTVAARNLAPALDSVVALVAAQDWDPAQGAKVEVRLEQAHRRAGRSAYRFAATLEVKDGAARWQRTGVLSHPLIAVLLAERGLSVRAVADRLGICPGYAHKLIDQGRHVAPGARRLYGPDAEAELAAWDSARRESGESPESEESLESRQSVESQESPATPEAAEAARRLDVLVRYRRTGIIDAADVLAMGPGYDDRALFEIPPDLLPQPRR